MKNSNKQLKIVGIGASASGLQALTAFLKLCPSDTGISFVIIQHLAPDYESMNRTLLARKTAMPVSVAEEGLLIEPNHIYLIPVNHNIILKDNQFLFSDRAPSRKINLPINLFFTSLAEEQMERAVGIILSGTGSDGTKGAISIKEAGGLVLVQNPKESGFPGMPQSVIDSGLADFVLNAGKIPQELVSYFNYSDIKEKKGELQIIDKILAVIKNETKYDFTSYRSQTLKRRIIKRKNINKLESLTDYKTFLENNDKEQDILANEFLIGVTRFFRDKAHFKTLKEKVIPQIIASKSKGEIIKLWVIGCGTGEEAYSIAILLNEALASGNKKKLNFKIFATDINLKAIEKASKGNFGLNISVDLDVNYLSKYFKKTETGYTILPHLRKHIVFSNHDILHNPPFNKMDLITCRNLLIYFQDIAQEKTIKNILYALKQNGYLFLGSSESLGAFSRYFEAIDTRGKIFKKKKDFDGVRNAHDVFSTQIDRLPSKKLPEIASELTIQIAKKLALVTNSVCICVNEYFQILEVYGSLRMIGSLPYEGFSTNLLKLLPKEFHVPIATAIRILSKSEKKTETIIKFTNFNFKETTYNAKIILERFDQRAYPHEKFYLIAIKVEELATDQIKLARVDTTTATNIEIQQLQTLLEDTSENLKLTIEELESSNEEAQATNEELVSSNEELQSTNEELQSVNEELYTVNSELQEKNVQLLELNSDIENLINSSPIASLFLDNRLHIRKFTPSLRNIINLWETDIERSITNFSLPDKQFLNDAKVVIKNNDTLRKKIFINNNWYLQEIHSYISSNEKNKGVVVNYTNITDLEKVFKENERKSGLLNDILDLFPGKFFIYDLEDKKLIFFNPSFAELLGYSPKEIEKMGSKILRNLIHSEDLERMTAYFQNLGESIEKDFATNNVRLITKNNKTIQMETVDRYFETKEDGIPKSILSFLTIKETNIKIDNSKKENLYVIMTAIKMLKEELVINENDKFKKNLEVIINDLEQLK